MIQAKLILDTTTNTTGSTIQDIVPGGTFQAVITGTGAVATTATIYCSLDAVNWLSLGVMTLSGTTTATDGFVSQGEWPYYRAITTGTTGTVSSIKVMMTEQT